ncbi:MAG: peptidase S53, partial [Bryobacteraceae bacterium]
GPNLVSLIYAAAASPFYRYRFYDVTTGTAGSFAAGLGWDQTTGLGVPLSPSLASYLVNIVP